MTRDNYKFNDLETANLLFKSSSTYECFESAHLQPACESSWCDVTTPELIAAVAAPSLELRVP